MNKVKTIINALKFIGEGLIFLLALGSIFFFVITMCALIDRCYYYYVPGGLGLWCWEKIVAEKHLIKEKN